LILQHISSAFFALLVSVFLLAFPLEGYAAIEDFKYNLFLLLCGGYCAVILIKRTQLAITGIQPFGKIPDSIKTVPTSMKLLFLFLAFTILSAVLSGYEGTFRGAFRREGALSIAIYILSCFFLSQYLRPKKWMLFALGSSTLLFCALSLIQMTGANPFMLFPEGHNFYGAGVYFPGEFLGTLGNTGLVGAFLSIVAGVFSMAIIKCEFRKGWHIAALAAPLTLVMILIFEMDIEAALLALISGLVLMLPVAVTNQASLSRTLFVAAVVISAFSVSQAIVFGDRTTAFAPAELTSLIVAGFVALLAIAVPKIKAFEKIPMKLYRLGSAVVVFAAICFAVTYLWFFGSGHTGMIYEASEVLRGRWDDSFGSTRVYIWRSILSGITQQGLLLGTGPDTLGFWSIEPFARYIPEFGVLLVAQIDSAHNEYLQILATGGLLSLLSYLGALVLAAKSWLSHPSDKLSAIAGAGVLFYCIQAFFGISMFIAAPFFWACLAVLIHSQNSLSLKRSGAKCP